MFVLIKNSDIIFNVAVFYCKKGHSMFKNGVLQKNQRDCSVACLATIVRIFGGNIPMERIRELIKVDNQGGTIYGILEASKKIGLESEALSGTFEELIQEIESGNIKLPCIAHIINSEGMSHFIVLTSITKKNIALFDPGFGYKKIFYNEFIKLWTGKLITFSQDNLNHLEKESKIKSFKKYFVFLKKNYSLFVITTLISMVLAISSIAISYVYKFTIDKTILGNDLNSSESVEGTLFKSLHNILENKYSLLLVVFVFFSVQLVFSILRSVFVSNISKNMNDDLYHNFITHILHLDVNFFYSRNTGEILSRYQVIIDIQQAMSKVFLTIILELFSLAAGSFVLGIININLFMIVCAMATIYIVISLIFVQPINVLNKKKIEVNGIAMTFISESLQGIETIKTEILEQRYIKKFMKTIDKLTTYVKKEIQISNILLSLVTVVESFFMILILLKGSLYITNGTLTIGSLILFLSLIPFFILPIKNIMEIQPDIQKLYASMGKLNDILDTTIEDNYLYVESKDDNKKMILTLNNVSHSYNFEDECLKEINFQINKNEKIAIIGKSGSGKSTLLKVISSLVTPDTGNLKVSKSIGAYTKKEYRKKLGYISQKCELFTGTIEDNVLLNTDKCNLDKYDHILEEIGFNDFIKSCPEGLKTKVIEQGNNFSGGQQQLIVIARLLISDVKFLFLDEGTANLDSLGEKKIIKYLTKIKNKLVISIFHNIELAQYYEKIIVMDKGQIVGIGTHKELIENNNYYKQLYYGKEKIE